MKLGIFTIVLDGMPFITWHKDTFNELDCFWKWAIIEGAALNYGDTRWCKRQTPRLSNDGTTEYLQDLALDPRVVYEANPMWFSKTQMCNRAVSHLKECDILLEVDVDEFHTVANIARILYLFENNPKLSAIRMPCRFFVGHDLVCVGENCWSNRATEWMRAWRYDGKQQFTTHEPPSLFGSAGQILQRREASKYYSLTFDHLAYVNETQVKYKEQFYGYKGLVNQWKSLQRHTKFPDYLGRFFPFADGGVKVKRLDPTHIPDLLKP